MSESGSRVPPRLAAWLIARVLPTHAREVVLGDLHERWLIRSAREGAWTANRWYWRQAGAFLLRVPAARAGGLLGSRRGVATGWPDAAAVPAARTVARSGITSGFFADVRLAGRALRRRPGLTLTATFVLALAVGANTTVFTVVDAVLLQRLPYPEPDRLVMLWDAYSPESRLGERMPITLAHYHAWTERTELFSAVGAWESTTPALVAGEWPERIDAALVTSNLLPLLGARPIHGRLLRPEDELPGAEPVLVLSYGLWASRFGADPGVVGRTIGVNGIETRVVGVLAEEFWFYDPYSATRSLEARNAEAARLWQPLPAEGVFGGETDYPRYRVIARVRDGLSMEAVARAASLVRTRLPPTSAGEMADVRVVPLTEQVLAEARPRLLALFGAVALVLLIACVNLVSLLLVHLESRRSELAVRAALGAGRARLMRQLVVESTMLALGGGLAGLLVSVIATSWLLDMVPRGLPLAHRVRLDATVAVFGVGLGALTGIAIGLVSTLKLDPGRLAGAISATPRTMAGTRTSRRLHGTLVAVEVALSLVLLIAATLLLRSLVSLHATETGFDAARVLTFEAELAPAADGPRDIDFFAQLESRVSNLPGVVAAGATSALPFSRWAQSARVEASGSAAPAGEAPFVDHRLVSPGYFRAIGLPVLAGRAFGSSDREGSTPVAIVNEAFVDRWLEGDAGAIGRTVTVTRGQERSEHTIVGVVANVKHAQLFETERPILYAPVRQTPLPFQRFAVRAASGDPLRLVEPIRRIAADIDPVQPLQSFITFEALVAQSIEQETFHTQVVATFAATAVLLTLIGIYGVVSYATRQRDREVAIRMALGAGAGRVHGLVLRQGIVPVAFGLMIGCLGGIASTRLLRGLLHGVPENDAVSYALAIVGFAAVAIVACLVPAHRASRLDPMRVMREQ